VGLGLIPTACYIAFPVSVPNHRFNVRNNTRDFEATTGLPVHMILNLKYPGFRYFTGFYRIRRFFWDL